MQREPLLHQIIIRVNPGPRAGPVPHPNRINSLARLAPALRFSSRQGVFHRRDCRSAHSLAPP
jgi:hypothetical protein